MSVREPPQLLAHSPLPGATGDKDGGPWLYILKGVCVLSTQHGVKTLELRLTTIQKNNNIILSQDGIGC